LVCEQLVGLIVSGALAPGTRLVEAELAAELGVSRLPVREALLALSKDGWVDLHVRRGARVHVPVDGEVDDVFDVRAALEAEAGRRAALRRSPCDVERLRAQVESGSWLAQSGKHWDTIRANGGFHRSVAVISGNELLESALYRLERRVLWYFGRVVIRRRGDSWSEQALVVDAIEAGDADRASVALRTHVETTRMALHARSQVDLTPTADIAKSRIETGSG
jgi:DNA-binding GntR family transcriptional regulator